MKKAEARGGDGDRRLRRVEREIREILSLALLRGVGRDFENQVVISRIQVSRDLKTALVLVVDPWEPKNEANLLNKLAESAPQLQKQLAIELRLKFTPKLKFVWDSAYFTAMKVEKILRELKVGETSQP